MSKHTPGQWYVADMEDSHRELLHASNAADELIKRIKA